MERDTGRVKKEHFQSCLKALYIPLPILSFFFYVSKEIFIVV